MIKRTLLAGAATLLIAAPAYAFHCPKDAAAIDHGLKVLNVSDETKSEVMALRDKGMEQHNAGKHADAVNTLAQGMRTLLMKAE